MSIAERSINFHRKTFKGLVIFTLVSIVIMAVVLGNYDHKLMIWTIPIFTLWMMVLIIRAYRNWVFIIKNKKELEALNLHSDKDVIFIRKNLF